MKFNTLLAPLAAIIRSSEPGLADYGPRIPLDGSMPGAAHLLLHIFPPTLDEAAGLTQIRCYQPHSVLPNHPLNHKTNFFRKKLSLDMPTPQHESCSSPRLCVLSDETW